MQFDQLKRREFISFLGGAARRKLIRSSAARANPRGPAAEVADTAVGKAVSRRQK